MNFVKTDRTCPKCHTTFGAVADRCRCPQCGHWFLESEVRAANEEDRRDAKLKELARQWKNRPAADDMPSRAEFAGFEPEFSIEAKIGAYEHGIATSPSIRFRVHDAMQLITLHHFGFFNGDVVKLSRDTIDIAKQYFDGVYQGENDSRGWFKTYANGLFVALLLESETSVFELSRSLTLPCEVDYLPLIAWEIQILHQLIAAKVTKNEQAVEAALTTLAQSKRGRGKLYAEAFIAIDAKDPKTFQKRLLRALNLFAARKKPLLDATYPTEWVSITASTLMLLAKRENVQVPTLPHHLDALILSPQSLGITECA